MSEYIDTGFNTMAPRRIENIIFLFIGHLTLQENSIDYEYLPKYNTENGNPYILPDCISILAM